MKQTIPVLGINRAETDLTVKDGACEKLHNLRFDAGAWRNVEEFLRTANITDYSGFEVLYKHPATEKGYYIAIDKTGVIHEVTVKNGVLSSTQKIIADIPAPDMIFSFGYVLVIVAENQELYFMLYGNDYVAFNIPEPPDISGSKTIRSRIDKIDFYINTDSKDYVSGDDISRYPAFAPERAYYVTRLTNKENKTLLIPLENGNYWIGEIAMMVAYRMIDGTVISNSELMIFAADGDDGENGNLYSCMVTDSMPNYVPDTYRTGIYVLCGARYAPGTNNSYIQPEINIKIPNGIDTRLIESVAIYSTRIMPLYDFEKTWSGDWRLSDRGGNIITWDFTKLFTTDNDLIQQPLHRVKEVKIRDFKDNMCKVYLTSDVLSNAESLPVFEPTQSLHKQVAKCYYEYNARLHKGNVRTQFFSGYSHFCLGDESADINTRLICTIDIENTRKQVCQLIPNHNPTKIRRIVSYPDYRAVQFAVCLNDPGSMAQKWMFEVKLEPCKANNYAYAIQKPYGSAKYPCFKMEATPLEHTPFIKADDVYYEPNRVQVSAPNNMFSMPFENSYRVGLNEERILAMATVVDELSASRFGAFPLYVFTDRGVWSLESGSGEVLYSNVLPVNYDKINNPNTCAAFEQVFYITSRGIHSLRGRTSQLISREIEHSPGELTDYLASARFYFQFKYGDLLVYNNDYRYAYVYSLSTGVWSTRDVVGTVLNNGEIVTKNAIATLEDEAASVPKECLIVTRPVKFGSTEFKRLETVVTRIMSMDCFAHIVVEGSNDCSVWSVLRDTWCCVRNMDARLRRTATSFKFYRFSIHLTANNQLSTTGIDVEFYPRFVGRMR